MRNIRMLPSASWWGGGAGSLRSALRSGWPVCRRKGHGKSWQGFLWKRNKTLHFLKGRPKGKRKDPEAHRGLLQFSSCSVLSHTPRTKLKYFLIHWWRCKDTGSDVGQLHCREQAALWGGCWAEGKRKGYCCLENQRKTGCRKKKLEEQENQTNKEGRRGWRRWGRRWVRWF